MFSSISESEKLRCGEEGGIVLLEGEFAGDGDAEDLKNILLMFFNPNFFGIGIQIIQSKGRKSSE